jgi:hypothetical protein
MNTLKITDPLKQRSDGCAELIAGCLLDHIRNNRMKKLHDADNLKEVMKIITARCSSNDTIVEIQSILQKLFSRPAINIQPNRLSKLMNLKESRKCICSIGGQSPSSASNMRKCMSCQHYFHKECFQLK